jgi:dihydrofolate reductase
MIKLKLQMQMSVDGYVAGPNGELDWMTWNWDEGIKKYVADLTDTVDTIVLGRKMTEGFVSHWTDIVKNKPGDDSYPFAQKMVDYRKVVFSKTLRESPWANTTVAKGDVVQEVNLLKNENGKDIIAYGGAGFVTSLIKNDLIDEFYLFVNPTAIGRGLAIFHERTNFRLVGSLPFDCGIVGLHYVTVR